MTLHLAEIAKQVAPGAHAVVVLDGAGWHRQGGELRVPDNLTLPSSIDLASASRSYRRRPGY